MAAKSKLVSVLTNRCPACREGKLFTDKNPYNLGSLTSMPDACTVCGEDFKREPGFYFGAAYVSYALTIAVWVAVLVALITFNALGWIEYSFYENPLTLLVTGITTLLVLLPILYRMARSIWISFFVKYKGEEKDRAVES